MVMKRFAATAPRYRPPAIFCDFDGTITTEESDKALWKKLGVTSAHRKLLNSAILNGSISQKEGFKLLIEEISARNTFDEALELARTTYEFDQGFRSFFEWCRGMGIPVFVVSSGLTPAIRIALNQFLGPKDASLIRIIANDVAVDRNGRFSMVFRHPDSPHGHVKSQAMDDYRASRGGRGRSILFVGDGVSDTTAARSADLLFVKISPTSSNDLATYCKRSHIPFRPVSNFYQVLNAVGSLAERRTSIDDLLWETWWDEKEDRGKKEVEDGWSLVAAPV